MTTFRKAVNGKCKDCIYDTAGRGNWKEQVTMCTSLDCPLWEIRPKCRKPSQGQARKLLFWMETSRALPEAIEACLGSQIREFGP